MSHLPLRRNTVLAASLAASALLVTACGGSSTTTSSSATTTGGSASATNKLPSGTLNASGSTFQEPFDLQVIQQFDAAHSGVTINYAGGGSSKGQSDLKSNLVQFAGTDSLVADPTPYAGGGILYFPTVVGPITLSYNLSGVKNLTLSAATIAKIYSGTITTWNNPAITALNPGVKLPSESITPVHRSDGSGTTSNFTKYLTKADPSDWKLGSASTVDFPGGLAGSGNPGVATAVKQTDGSIGYVDYSDAVATGLPFASIRNAAGQVVAPSLAGASAAAAGATVAADLTYDPTDASGAAAYPITSPTWIIVTKSQTNPARTAILKAFLTYILTTGQGSTATKLNYAPLPAPLDKMALAQVNQL